MSTNRPDASELIESVREMMEAVLLPALQDKSLVYQARVAVNVLKIVEREMAQIQSVKRLERESLQSLLHATGEAPELNAELVRRIHCGDFDKDDGELMAHFQRTVVAKLAIDNPEYRTLKDYLASGEIRNP